MKAFSVLLMTISYLQVNTVIQIPTTTVRILLNHFKWDKEKLMERYYSDDQEAMYVLIIILLMWQPFKFVLLLQLEEYKTDPKFLELSQNLTTDSVLIYVFCTCCEPECVLPVLKIKTKTIHVRSLYKTRKWTKNWRNYGSVSYFFFILFIFFLL